MLPANPNQNAATCKRCIAPFWKLCQHVNYGSWMVRTVKIKLFPIPISDMALAPMKYADGTTREFYQIGLSANKTGISVYILGIEDKKYLAEAYGKELGKASVTGYCIRFKTLKDINIEILEAAIRFGFKAQNEKVGTQL